MQTDSSTPISIADALRVGLQGLAADCRRMAREAAADGRPSTAAWFEDLAILYDAAAALEAGREP